MDGNWDMAVFWFVVGLRFFVPLLIPRWPLPAILACLIIDGIDQTIFQTFTNLELEGYQGYDKALDIYYLAIAYISTLRNWSNLFAFQIVRFLFFWRLVGVTAFELTHLRPLLIIFPNTFEYFFIFYEAVRLRWDPAKMSKRLLIGAAAFIWIFIKLPQEWWLHIAQLDMTDFLKEEIFGVDKNASWSEAFSAAPEIVVFALVAVVLLLVAAWWVITRKLPPADWTLKIAADPLPEGWSEGGATTAMRAGAKRLVDSALVEKITMIALVSIIFAQVLPNIRASNLEVAVGVAFIVVLNTAISHWLARRGRGWESALREFAIMVAVNAGLLYLYAFLLPNFDGTLDFGNSLFFVLLLTMLVTLYDRYKPVQMARMAAEA